ncbi:MAG: hypothetical protein ACOX8Q_04640 [Christensenellales bacterium]
MPDGLNTPRGVRGGFPGGFRGGFHRDFRRFPERRFPRFFFFPIGFPRYRCDWIDQYGRCCDRFGRCCDRFGRCDYYGSNPGGGWYGMPGSWDMMTSYYDRDDDDTDRY